MYIDTPEQYYAWRNAMQPVILAGKGKVRIPAPCANTVLVRRSMVVANTYNPNHVSPDKMELLRQSVLDNGFAFPCVVIWDSEAEQFVIVDGFHRFTVTGPDWLDLEYVPVAVLDHNAAQRLAATWQFNKARGSHEVDLDADLIRALIEQGMSDEEITVHLGIDLDTVHRYKQITGIAALFANSVYSLSWHMREVEEGEVLNG
jgi:ParB-like chromosome segregation protein Spo0J